MAWWFKIDLWKRVIVMLVLGLIIGLGMRQGMGAEAAGAAADTYVKWAGDLFLRLIRMLIVPLVFFTLVSGVIAMGDPKRLGSLGLKTIALYFGTTAVAVTLGLIMATIFQPGASLSPETFAGADTSKMVDVTERAAAAGGIVDRLLAIVPTNPVAALANGDILPIIFFAIIFGVGILLAGQVAKPVADFFEGASEAMMKVTMFIMETAPFGVLALMITVMANHGLGVLQSLGTLTIALYLACALHIAITYGGVIIKLLLRLPVVAFFRGVTDAQAVALFHRFLQRDPAGDNHRCRRKPRPRQGCGRVGPATRARRSIWMARRSISAWSPCSAPQAMGIEVSLAQICTGRGHGDARLDRCRRYPVGGSVPVRHGA